MKSIIWIGIGIRHPPNVKSIQYKLDDFSTNCTSGCSIPTRPVLSSSITKAGKDDQVDQEQAAHGEHEKMTRRWTGTIIRNGEHDNSYGLQGRKTLSQREGPPWRSDLQQPGQPPLALRAPPPWKEWLANVIAIDMDIFNNKNILNLGKDRDILNNISNLASLHIALGWQMCIHIQYTFAYMQ